MKPTPHDLPSFQAGAVAAPWRAFRAVKHGSFGGIAVALLVVVSHAFGVEQGGGLTLPGALENDPVATLLAEGRYEEAWAQVDRRMEQPGELAKELYVRGLARLKLAEQVGDVGLLKEAGLDFMRVVAYFPRSGYAAPALVEGGYIHVQIDRPDIAGRLYEQASAALDPERESAYVRRLRRLRNNLSSDAASP